MSRFDLKTTWLPEPPPGWAFGPERHTWASLEIWIDGERITTNVSAEGGGDEQGGVVGGMSELADWVVENWLALRFEIHTPFPKAPSFTGARAGRLPSLRDAMAGWPAWVAENDKLTGGDLGAWQQRHTLGVARSDLALPSIVFLPEDAWTGVGLDHIPAALGPSVRFCPPGGPGAWPGPLLWLPAADVAGGLASFVDSVIERLAGFPESERPRTWLAERWRECRRLEADPGAARRWALGATVAGAWESVRRALGERAAVLEGILADASTVEAEETLDALVALVAQGAGARSVLPALDEQVDWALPPWREGYRLAQIVRGAAGLGAEPIPADGLEGLLAGLDVKLGSASAHGLFRSACWSSRTGAELVWADDDPLLSRPPPRRFAIAAALGRLLATPADARLVGLAHGPQGRLRPTQLANAFAAELLLPVQAIQRSKGTTETLARRFGISKSAAEWHVRNRAARIEA